VTRKAQEGETKNSNNNYAIIFENKINWAPDGTGYKDANGQLDHYVEAIKKLNYEYKDIHVFYLPLNSDKDPRPEDLEAIRKKIGCDNYKKITFANQILTWLNDLSKYCNVKEGMRDNLNHYKNLITYLVNKDKESKMSIDIFEQIKKTEKEPGKLPSSKDAIRVQAAVNELVPCLQIHESLKEVEAEIRRQDPQTEIVKNFPYDDGEAVGLKVSGVEAILWFVYGFTDEDKEWFFVCQYINDAAQRSNFFDKECFCWEGEKQFPYKKASEVLVGKGNFNTPDLLQETAQLAAKKLMEWRGSFI
jgi:hypothetical protein